MSMLATTEVSNEPMLPTTEEEAFVRVEGLRKEFGASVAVEELSVSLQRGQMLALLGPSGCGKTTSLRMLAGLERPTSGTIAVAGRTLVDGRKVVPPEDREMGMVFQSYALWPHMTVHQNIAYPLRRRRMAKAQMGERVSQVLELVGMAEYESRPVTNLSGGQQQRVAVARALAARPNVLLMDEPLSNLDAVLRESMRFEIRQLQQENDITAVYVTHNQEEALAIADLVGVMKDGRLEQIGRPEELYTTPRNEFVASFIGLANVVHGLIEQIGVDSVVIRLPDGGRLRARLGHVDPGSVAPDGTLSVAIRPEQLRLVAVQGSHPPPVSDRQAIEGRVVNASFSGNLIDYFIEGEAGTIRCQAFPPAVAQIGDQVRVECDWTDCVALVA